MNTIAPKISRLRSHRSPALFVQHQSVIPKIRATEIELFQSACFCILDGTPEQQLHGAMLEMLGFTTGVLINQGIFETEHKESPDGLPVLGCEPDDRLITKGGEQVGKPLSGLGREAMALAGVAQKSVEAIDKRFRPAFFIRQSITFGPADFSLN
jgi:hypothetical protein